MIFVIGFFGWPYIGRMVRGQTLSMREREFVEAARSSAPALRTSCSELLPNLVAPIIVYTTMIIPTNILIEAALCFLGVGVKPPTASWGGMLADAMELPDGPPGMVVRVSRSSSPCCRSTCSGTACAMRWTPRPR